MLHLARTTNDAYVTGDADLDLQDVLADATGMRRAAPMFRTTTALLLRQSRRTVSADARPPDGTP